MPLSTQRLITLLQTEASQTLFIRHKSSQRTLMDIQKLIRCPLLQNVECCKLALLNRVIVGIGKNLLQYSMFQIVYIV